MNFGWIIHSEKYSKKTSHVPAHSILCCSMSLEYSFSNSTLPQLLSFGILSHVTVFMDRSSAKGIISFRYALIKKLRYFLGIVFNIRRHFNIALKKNLKSLKKIQHNQTNSVKKSHNSPQKGGGDIWEKFPTNPVFFYEGVPMLRCIVFILWI